MSYKEQKEKQRINNRAAGLEFPDKNEEEESRQCKLEEARIALFKNHQKDLDSLLQHD